MSGRRVPTPAEVGPVTADLCLLSDCVSTAFVDGGGTLRWLSREVAEAGSAATDGSLSGTWSLRPEGEAETSRRYLPGTLVLETTFVGPHGRAVLVDALLLGSGERGHFIGQVPPATLVRSLRVTEGSLSVVGRLEPPPGGGWVLSAGVLSATVGSVRLRVRGPAPDAVKDGVAVWRRQLPVGSDLGFRMQLAGPGPAADADVAASLEDTCEAWRSWSALHQSYEGSFRDEVRLSGRILKALTTAARGRQEVGRLGHALSVATCLREAEELLRSSLAASMSGSQQCRSSTAGAELLDAVDHVGAAGTALTDEQGRHATGIVDAAAQRWGPADPQQRAPGPALGRDTHSAVMDWTILDRGLQRAGILGAAAQGRQADWHAARHQVQRALLTEAWSPSSGCYAQGFGSDIVHSSALWLCLSGLLPATDPRMRSTVEAVADALSAPCGLLYRYEGAQDQQSPCLASTYWLVQCLARSGQCERATAVFEQATAYASDLGLLAAEGNPTTGELHGAFPDVEAHAALVNAAADVTAALARAADRALA